MGSGDPLLVSALLRLGPGLLAEAAWSVMAGSRRSLATDAARMIERLHPRPEIEGQNHIPPRGPFFLVGNHYQAPRLWIGWIAAAITQAVATVREPGAREIHWMMVADWRRTVLGVSVSNPLSSLVFPRAARTYGLIPIPSEPGDVRGRARALMRALEYLGRRGKGMTAVEEPVAMFPEGAGTVDLQPAKSGSGAFLHRVSSMGVPVLPVGAFDENGKLRLRFGESFRLPAAPPEGETLDDWARREVMVSIGRLLPEHLWGAYADAVRESRKLGLSDRSDRTDRSDLAPNSRLPTLDLRPTGGNHD